MALRLALLYSSAERYATLVASFVSIIALSRLLTPQEIGISVIGATMFSIAELLRDVPSTYLVQQPELTQEDTRTAFTSMLILSVLLAAGLAAAAPSIARSYSDPGIAAYLQVVALTLLINPVERPLMALFRREMAFRAYAIVNVTSVAVSTSVTIGLVLLGLSYMSFAWGMLAGALTASLLALYFKPAFWIFRLTMTKWRTAARFSSYTSLWAFLTKISELFPYFILSRLFPLETLSFYNRMTIMNSIPEKLIFSGITPVIFPAFAAEHRLGLDLRKSFLKGAAYVTAVAWPSFILLVIFAHPAVRILLGSQWLTVVPLVQTSAFALIFVYPAYLAVPTLMAIGALRSLVITALIALPFNLAITTVAAMRGLEAVALSLMLTVPFQAAVYFWFLRSHLNFSWTELIQSVKPSALITLCATAIPLAGVAARGFDFKMPIWAALLLGFGGLAGWVAGIWLTDHPLKHEIVKLLGMVQHRISHRLPRNHL